MIGEKGERERLMTHLIFFKCVSKKGWLLMGRATGCGYDNLFHYFILILRNFYVLAKFFEEGICFMVAHMTHSNNLLDENSITSTKA